MLLFPRCCTYMRQTPYHSIVLLIRRLYTHSTNIYCYLQSFPKFPISIHLERPTRALNTFNVPKVYIIPLFVIFVDRNVHLVLNVMIETSLEPQPCIDSSHRC